MSCTVLWTVPHPGEFCKKSVPCAGAGVNRTWKRPIQRRSLGNSHRAGRRVRGKEGAGFFAVGFNRPASLRSSGAGCFPHMYVEKLYGTKRYARCIGAGRKDAGQSGRWGSSSACFYFTRPLIFVLRRRALRDVLLCLLFMGNNAFVKQVFNRHSKRMGNSFQCFQAHFPDSAAPGAGV